MAYASRDRDGWIADFRPLVPTPGKRHRRRVPRERLRGQTDEASAAQAWAQACEAACTLLRAGTYTAADVQHALELGAIEGDQATSLLDGRVRPAAEPAPVSIEDAALAHSATKAMPIAKRWRYLKLLAGFTQRLGSTRLDHLTLQAVEDEVAHLKGLGWRWDSRRHALMFVRRAAAMMPALINRPDPLASIRRLDRRAPGEEPVPEAFSVDELAAGLVWCERELATLAAAATAASADEKPIRRLEREAHMHRARCLRAAIVLGGFCGFDPKETYSPRCGSLVDGMIETGSKNSYRRRTLPVPATALPWLVEIVRNRGADEQLLRTHRFGRDGDAVVHVYGNFSAPSWSRWAPPLLAAACGRRLAAGCLRKSFATWAFAPAYGLPPQHVEAYLGHRHSALIREVSTRHYRARWLAEQLRPTTLQIDAVLRTALARARQGVPVADRATESATACHNSLSIR